MRMSICFGTSLEDTFDRRYVHLLYLQFQAPSNDSCVSFLEILFEFLVGFCAGAAK